MQLFGGLDIVSFVRKSLLNWIDYVNRNDSERKVSRVFKTNSQGNANRATTKEIMGICVQADTKRR